MCFNGFKRIHGIAKAFGHLVPVLVQYQSVGNYILEGYRIKQHRRYGMKRKEPSAGLVHPFRNKTGRE